MARTILVWSPTGIATPTCKLMLRSAPLTLVETITLTEHATIKRAYTGTVTASAAQYKYNFLSAGVFIGGGSIYVGATDGLTYEEDNSLDWANIVNPTATVGLTGTTVTLTTGERDSIAAALLDLAAGIETGVTPRQAIRAISAILAGIISGAGTGSEVFRAIGAASGGTTRATVTVDSSGNRTAVSLP